MLSFEKPDGGARGGEKKEKPEGCTTVFIGNLSWSIDEVRYLAISGCFGAQPHTSILRHTHGSLPYINFSRGQHNCMSLSAFYREDFYEPLCRDFTRSE